MGQRKQIFIKWIENKQTKKCENVEDVAKDIIL